MESQTIVGHVSPDWDCIAALWLLQRYGPFKDADIVLVPAGEAGPQNADAVVDTGRVFDPVRWRFDHHQFPGTAASATCAAEQVYTALFPAHTAEMAHLVPLIALVTDGDRGGADYSRTLGIHALLSARKAGGGSDMNLIDYGYSILDDLDAGLRVRQEARHMLDTYMVYRSADGLVAALDGAPRGATEAAFEAGAQIVIWHSPMPETIAVGINRARESGIDCAAIVARALQNDDLQLGVVAELETWYRHPSGFFAGRGTPKAPDTRPLAAPFADIVAALNNAARR